MRVERSLRGGEQSKWGVVPAASMLGCSTKVAVSAAPVMCDEPRQTHTANDIDWAVLLFWDTAAAGDAWPAGGADQVFAV